jgi:LmbE family N-acetylglucosaminyl deacetylase
VTQATYSRRTAGKLLKSEKIAEIFTPWNSSRECWLFVSAHDDDIVCGCGLSFQAAIAEGIEVHAMVATDGRMGYCRLTQRECIAEIRRREASQSYRLLGLPAERLYQLPYPDGDLFPHRGRRLAGPGDPTAIEGATGLQNTFTHLLRRVRPTRVFLPSITDIHPDHRIVHEEMLISLFHAQGGIWPELGEPLAWIPVLYEYATYCDFLTPPQIRVAVPEALLERKLAGIRAYASQEQIELLAEVQRKAGAVEYLREVEFNVLCPGQYEELFSSPSPSGRWLG